MEKFSLTDQAYEILREKIVRYEIRPGSIVTSKELAVALKMSQTPVREALCILEHERFIERIHKKGYSVRLMDAQDVRDLYDLRIGVETVAAERAAESISKEGLRHLEKTLKRIDNAILNRKKASILKHEQSFHLQILQATKSWIILEIGRSILERIWMLQKIILFSSEHWDESQKQHLELLDCLTRGDAQQSHDFMKRHLDWGKALVLDRIHDKDDFMGNIVVKATHDPDSNLSGSNHSGQSEKEVGIR